MAKRLVALYHPRDDQSSLHPLRVLAVLGGSFLLLFMCDQWERYPALDITRKRVFRSGFVACVSLRSILVSFRLCSKWTVT
jgi:hypothetical protein